MPVPIVARLAPSPTGAQHVGNARTFLLAWLSARSQGGRVILRIEDIDSPRVKPWAVQQALDDLRWLGLDWDAGPDAPGRVGRVCESHHDSTIDVVGLADSAHPTKFAESYIQTERRELYRTALDELRRRELVYPCTCTRSDIESAASAPHAGQEGPLYPGTCRHRSAAGAVTLGDQPFAWRFRISPVLSGGRQPPEDAVLAATPSSLHSSNESNEVDAAVNAARTIRGLTPPAQTAVSTYTDLHAGPQFCDVPCELGDFVVGKADGTPAYQLAVVVDDHLMGVTEVVRGDDLIPSTFRQLALYDAFGWPPPQFAHVPLVIGPDGRRLAKRHGDTRLSVLRNAGVPAERLVGLLAWTCGLQPSPTPIAARDLIDRFDWRHVPRTPLVFTPSMWDGLLNSSRRSGSSVG